MPNPTGPIINPIRITPPTGLQTYHAGLTGTAPPPVPGELHTSIPVGVLGTAQGNGLGVVGTAAGAPGVVGASNTGSGVNGHSQASDGVLGSSTSPQHAGVAAINDSGGFGVWARAKTAGHFQGNVEVTGDVVLLGAGDCAEQFHVQEDVLVEPGAVMVLDEDETLRMCERGYDRKVAGVISGAGDFRPGLILAGYKDAGNASHGSMPLALVGRVHCKVDAEYGPVEAGDLLTSSPTIGHAMKAVDPIQSFGAVIGKALRPLRSGRGLVPILVALQ